MNYLLVISPKTSLFFLIDTITKECIKITGAKETNLRVERGTESPDGLSAANPDGFALFGFNGLFIWSKPAACRVSCTCPTRSSPLYLPVDIWHVHMFVPLVFVEIVFLLICWVLFKSPWILKNVLLYRKNLFRCPRTSFFYCFACRNVIYTGLQYWSMIKILFNTSFPPSQGYFWKYPD